jgi:WhiB family redox-sensing transcriptional regulator
VNVTILHPTYLQKLEDDPPHWREEALCLAEDSADFFFPGGDRGQTLKMTNAARTVCSGCAVRIDCLLYATETQQDYGVWGGATEPERRKLRRKLRHVRTPQAAIELLMSS